MVARRGVFAVQKADCLGRYAQLPQPADNGTERRSAMFEYRFGGNGELSGHNLGT